MSVTPLPMEFISLLLSVLGIALTIYYFYKRPRPQKRVTVTPTVETPVFNLAEPIPDLQILHKGKQIQQLYVMRFKLANIGNQDIEPDDFRKPLECSLNADIVDARVIDRNPPRGRA